MKTTASIVTYRTNPQELALCIECLLASEVDKIYIIDNSPDRKIENLLPESESISYIHNFRNIGYGAAHNIAIRKAMDENAEYHLVLNSDTSFGKDVVGKIVRFMDSNPDVGQLAPNIIYPDGRQQYTVRLLPSPADLMFRRFLPPSIGRKRDFRYLLKMWNHKSPLNIPYHQGSFMFFRTSALKTVGLFDERFFMYPEDIDITRRMHRRYKTLFWPEVTVTHDHRAASYHSLRMLMVHSINMMRYFNKWGWFNDAERRELNNKILNDIQQQK